MDCKSEWFQLIIAIHVPDVVRALKHIYTINAITIKVFILTLLWYSLLFNLCFLLSWVPVGSVTADNIITVSLQYRISNKIFPGQLHMYLSPWKLLLIESFRYTIIFINGPHTQGVTLHKCSKLAIFRG